MAWPNTFDLSTAGGASLGGIKLNAVWAVIFYAAQRGGLMENLLRTWMVFGFAKKAVNQAVDQEMDGMDQTFVESLAP